MFEINFHKVAYIHEKSYLCNRFNITFG